MTSIKDVAAKAGVSISTVSYALSGKRSISEATKLRVVRAARELGYFPNAGASMLRGDLTHIIALSSPIHRYTDSVNYAAFFFETVRVARQHHYDVLLLAGEEEDDQLDRMAVSHLVDGVILLDVAWNDERTEKAKLSAVPYVSIGVPKDVSGLRAVDLDFETMGQQAVDRLVKAGHRQVLFVGADQSISSKSQELTESNYLHRIRLAVKHRAEQRGIRLQMVTSRGDGIAAVRDLLDEQFALAPDISAIVTQVSLEHLSNIISVLKEEGRSIPDDVSLLSLATYGRTGLLSVPVDEMPLLPTQACTRALDLLMAAIAGEDSPKVELLPPVYVERGSIADRTQAV